MLLHPGSREQILHPLGERVIEGRGKDVTHQRKQVSHGQEKKQAEEHRDKYEHHVPVPRLPPGHKLIHPAKKIIEADAEYCSPHQNVDGQRQQDIKQQSAIAHNEATALKRIVKPRDPSAQNASDERQ